MNASDSNECPLLLFIVLKCGVYTTSLESQLQKGIQFPASTIKQLKLNNRLHCRINIIAPEIFFLFTR